MAIRAILPPSTPPALTTLNILCQIKLQQKCELRDVIFSFAVVEVGLHF